MGRKSPTKKPRCDEPRPVRRNVIVVLMVTAGFLLHDQGVFARLVPRPRPPVLSKQQLEDRLRKLERTVFYIECAKRQLEAPLTDTCGQVRVFHVTRDEIARESEFRRRIRELKRKIARM